MTDTDPDEQRLAALRAPFPPEQIGKLPKRSKKDDGTWGPTVYLDYVGHADVTDRLLNVDPFWTWEPMARDERGLPAYDERGNLWIRLTVCGVTRIGVGDGPDPKQRIGDALRNAAMRFGVALDLWAKGDRHFGDGHDAPPTRPEWLTKTYDLIAALAPDDKARLREWVTEQGLEGVEWTEEQAKAVRHRAHQIGKR